MRSSHILRGTVVLVSLFFVTHVSAFVNGQPGDSDWTIASNIGQDLDEVSPAFPTLIFQTDFVGGVGGTYTITQAGNYKLAESVNGIIRINTGLVDLDLNDHEVVFDAELEIIIEVQAGADRVSIHNGIVRHSGTPPGTQTGIQVNAVSHAVLKNLVVVGCLTGISLAGATDCRIEKCKLLKNSRGIFLDGSVRNFVHSCLISNGFDQGIYLFESNCNIISDCRVIDIKGPNLEAQGFLIGNANENLITGCVIKDISGSVQAYGIRLTNCSDNKVIDCLINGVNGPNYGIVATTTDNLIMRNKVYNCSSTGIFYNTGNLFIKNIAYNNGTNYGGAIPNTTAYDRTSSSNPSINLHNADIS